MTAGSGGTESPSPFDRDHVAVVGINTYAEGIPQLHNALNDAEGLAWRLEERGYFAHRCLEDVTRSSFLSFLETLAREVGEDDRVVFYFAGHGRAPDASLDQPGCLLTADADPLSDAVGLVTMDELKAALDALRCRHLLVILDCCYAGSFRWSSASRHGEILPSQPFREHYARYTEHQARQVLTSSAHDQKAHDALWGLGDRGTADHSPFAAALFDGIDGAADLVPRDPVDGRDPGNGLVTLTELYTYLLQRVEDQTAEGGRLQTPGFWALDDHQGGEFVFEVPGREAELDEAPELTSERNPYLGLEAFTQDERALFFGRADLVEEVVATLDDRPLIALLGASGSGKSSLLQAGVLPRLQGLTRRRPGRPWVEIGHPWFVVGPLRPGEDPEGALAKALDVAFQELDSQPDSFEAAALVAWLDAHPKTRLALAVDQLEELVTVAPRAGRDAFEKRLASYLAEDHPRLRVIVTLRIDFEAAIEGTAQQPGPLRALWRGGRLTVPPMDHVELRRVVVGPAGHLALFVERELVRELIKDVQQMPGALSLLSVALRELYEAHVTGRRGDRRLLLEDYEAAGRVGGSIRRRAYASLAGLLEGRTVEDAAALRETQRRVMLRMVSLRGKVATRRKVPYAELVYRDEEENERVDLVLEALEKERLVVPSAGGVEPAHDMLIRRWDELQGWIDQEHDELLLQRVVSGQSLAWQEGPAGTWWSDPRLRRLCSVPQRVHPWLKAPLALIQARPKSWLNHRELDFFEASWSQLRRRLATLGALVAVLLSIAAFFFWRQQIEQQETRSRRLASLSRLAIRDQPDLGLLLAAEANRSHDNPATQGALLGGVLAHPWLETHFAGYIHAVNDLAVDPRGELLAVASSEGVRLWDLAGRRLATHQPAGQNAGLLVAEFSSGGGRLAVAGSSGITWWQRDDSWQMPSHLEVPGVSAATFLEGASQMAVGTGAGEVQLVDLVTRFVQSIELRHQGAVTDLVFDARRNWLITAAMESAKPVRFWSLEQNVEMSIQLEPIPNRLGGGHSLTLSEDGKLLAVAFEDGRVATWSLSGGALVFHQRPDDAGTAQGVRWIEAPERRLASVHADGEWILWCLPKELGGCSERPQRFLADASGAYALETSESGTFLFLAGSSGSVRLWRPLRHSPLSRQLWNDIPKASEVGWIGPGSTLLELSDGEIYRHRPGRSEPSRERLTPEWSQALAVSPDGDRVLLLSGHAPATTLQVWHLATDRRVPLSWPATLEKTQSFALGAIAFSPDGALLAMAPWSQRPVIYLWETTDLGGRSRELLLGDRSYVSELLFNREGTALITTGSSVDLWQLDDAGPARRPLALEGTSAAAFAPEGQKLFLGNYEGQITLSSWTGSDPPITASRHHSDSVTALAVDPQGRFLVSASDEELKVWDAASLELISDLPLPEEHVPRILTFNADGTALVTAGFGIYVWDFRIDSWLKLAHRIANRPLTAEERLQYLY